MTNTRMNSGRRRPSNVKLRKGICDNHQFENPDTGEVGDCPACASGKVISVNVERLSDFKCPECGGRLKPAPKAPLPLKPIIIGLIVVALLIGLFFALRPLWTEDKAPVEPVPRIKPIPPGKGDPNSEDPTVIVTEEPPVTDNDSLEGQNKAIDNRQTSSDTKAQVTPTTPTTPRAPKVSPAPPQPRFSGGTLRGATFSGSVVNGAPHGHGTLTYKRTQLIDAHDGKGRTAEAGDYIIGQWHYGHLVFGTLYKQDGSVEGIQLGKFRNDVDANDPYFQPDINLYR